MPASGKWQPYIKFFLRPALRRALRPAVEQDLLQLGDMQQFVAVVLYCFCAAVAAMQQLSACAAVEVPRGSWCCTFAVWRGCAVAAWQLVLYCCCVAVLLPCGSGAILLLCSSGSLSQVSFVQ